MTPLLISPFLHHMFFGMAFVQDVPGVKVTTLGFNSRADSESKRHIHIGPICNGSGVMKF